MATLQYGLCLCGVFFHGDSLVPTGAILFTDEIMGRSFCRVALEVCVTLLESGCRSARDGSSFYRGFAVSLGCEGCLAFGVLTAARPVCFREGPLHRKSWEQRVGNLCSPNARAYGAHFVDCILL